MDGEQTQVMYNFHMIRVKAADFKKTVFNNGLTVLSERTPGSLGLSVGLWVKVGCRMERPSEAGISHFIEHMLFKGTEKRSALEITRSIEAAGGDFNAFTDREYTCFQLSLLKEDLQLGADILTDIILDPLFEPVELEREREVILQEIDSVEDNPEELAFDTYLQKVYGRSGLGSVILGTTNSIGKMKRSRLIKFFKSHYRPEKTIISVAGDVSHKSVCKRFKRLATRSWPGRPAGKQIDTSPVYKRPAVRDGRWWIERKTEQVHLIWGVEGVSFTARQRLPCVLINIHLGGGLSSLLFQEIREKRGLAYNVYSSLLPFADSGLFTVYVATERTKLKLCMRLIEEAVHNLCTTPLPEEELKSIKSNLKGNIFISSDDVESRMFSIARNEIFLRANVGIGDICERIDSVSADDVRRTARKLFGNEKRSILALGPEKPRLSSFFFSGK